MHFLLELSLPSSSPHCFAFWHLFLTYVQVASPTENSKNLILDGESSTIIDPSTDHSSHVSQENNSICTFVRDGVIHAFLGSHLSHAYSLDAPLAKYEDGPLILETKENLKDYFPLDFKLIFKGNPPVVKNTFCNLLEHITKSKGDQWKQQSFYDLIQLSTYNLHFNEDEIFAIIHFWHPRNEHFSFSLRHVQPYPF